MTIQDYIVSRSGLGEGHSMLEHVQAMVFTTDTTIVGAIKIVPTSTPIILEEKVTTIVIEEG